MECRICGKELKQLDGHIYSMHPEVDRLEYWTNNRDQLLHRVVGNVAPQENGCLLWTGFKVYEYGGIQFMNKLMYAHRFVWFVQTGEFLPGDVHLLHSCDTPPCVNIKHLRKGTIQDNIGDLMERGPSEYAKGLKRGDIIAIRESKPWTMEEMHATAKRYGTNPYTIMCIITGRTWKKLGGPRRPKLSRGLKYARNKEGELYVTSKGCTRRKS